MSAGREAEGAGAGLSFPLPGKERPMKKAGTLLGILLMASAALAQGAAGPHARESKRARTYVVPLILSAGGGEDGAQSTFDTTIFMTYTPGLAGLGAGPGASVDVYLFDNVNGNPLRSNNGQVVCNPCTIQLGAADSRQTVRVGELTADGGQFDAAVKLGFAVIVVGGADPDGVNLQGRVVSSQPGAPGPSVFTFEPQPIAAAAN